ncbi:MAG: GAF domain-containing protein [bacterium]|nr:GAF domain-containing protein [bacterium]
MAVAELQQRLEEYESLLEISVELAGSLDIEQVLELAMDRAERLCRAETSSIWEVDGGREELFFRIVRGTAADEIRHRRVPMGEGLVGRVAMSGEAEIVDDVTADPQWRGELSGTFKTKAVLTVPLKAHARVVGVLQLLNPIGKLTFSADDLERMRLFAAPLGQAIDNARLYSLLKGQFVDSVTALAEAIEKRDPYTGGHIQRVVLYSLLLGFEMGLSHEELEELRLASTLHDVGKIAVPDDVLRKPAPLSDSELRIMQRHTIDGADIVSRIRELRGILPGVRSHHERLDGKGYPDGLDDAEIPMAARIIAVADTYDAVTSSRPYRSAMAPEAAADEIYSGAGTQFCPEVVAAFKRLMERSDFRVAAGERLQRSLFGDGEQR